MHKLHKIWVAVTKAELKIVLIYILFLSTSAYSQERNLKKLSHHKQHKIAHNLIKRGSYYNASDQLIDLVKNFPAEREFTFRLAEAYFQSRDYKNAEQWFLKTREMDGKNSTIAQFHYAQCLKYNGKYELAKKEFSTFLNGNYKAAKNDKIKTIAQNEVASCDFAIKESKSPVFADIIHLGDNVNSAYTEFSPNQVDDKTLIFASLQSDSVLSAGHDEVHFYHVKLYTSDNTSGSWSVPTEMKQVNSKNESTANGMYSSDKTKFYFTKCRTDRDHEMVCNIYSSDVKDGELQKPEKLKGLINLEGSTFSQPFITQTGTGKSKADVLFFVSNMPGGKGGLDIWYTQFGKDGSCRKPVNLGAGINTIGDEMSPFYEKDSSVMYFSSNYHAGFGGYDIFKSKGQLSKWNKPQNLGMPINSSVDDTYFTMSTNKDHSYMVSNRPGGMQLKSATCCDDIYEMKYTPVSLISLNLFDKKDKGALNGATVVFLKEKDGKKDSLGNQQYDTVPYYVNKNPLPGFDENQQFFKPEKGKKYLLKVLVPGIDSAAFPIDVDNSGKYNYTADSISGIKVNNQKSPNSEILVVDMFLNRGKDIPVATITKDETAMEPERKKKIRVPKDYTTISDIIREKKISKKSNVDIEFKVMLNYEFDDVDFIEVNAGSLDSLVGLLKEYPDLRINIAAHSDSTGTYDYNMKISKKRASVLQSHLHSQGISKKRMSSQGFGFTNPIAPNYNSDGSINSEGMALNRRAEIKITRPSDNGEKKRK